MALGALLAVHLLLGLAHAGTFIPDDADQVIFSQSLERGYHEQPPLYSWLAWLFFRVFGLTFFAWGLLKTMILGAIYLALYRSAQLLLGGEGRAALAAFAVLLIPTFAWHSFYYLTHTNLVCAAGAATFYFLLRVQREGRWSSYTLLGLSLGLGTLSKYNYVCFATALLGAGLTISSFRVRLLHPRMIWSLLIAAVLVAPNASWAWDNRDVLLGTFNHKLGIDANGAVGGRAAGLLTLITNLSLILLPVGVLGWFLSRAKVQAEDLKSRASDDARKLLGRFLVGAFTLLVLMVALAGATRFHERWLQPFTLLAPLFAFSHARRHALPAVQRRRLVSIFAASALICAALRFGQLFVAGADRGIYSLRSDFTSAAEQLHSVVGSSATIIGADREICGNLRYQLPRARFICVQFPLYVPPLESRNGPHVLVWNTRAGESPPAPLLTFAKQMNLPAPVSPTISFLDVPSKLPGDPTNRLAFCVLVTEP
ncbi:MAG: family glycosyltransferase, 4-amino-4-deoxy-L-arabinose transferase [Chthoniobacter sp.]|nr:family glycosyltransferase, 4-amino-4-deoxy-L-arabinose transferase [Chthoniobacter sp.]